MLLDLLRLLPHLVHLHLQDIFVTSAPAAQDEHALTSVKTLIISSRQEEIPSSDVLLLFNCFRRVENLEVDVPCFYNFRRASAECPPPRALAVHTVSAHGSMSETLFVHLARSPSAYILHTLVLQDLEIFPLVGLQRLLAATHANLTRLSLSFRSFCGEPQAETFAIVSLACCIALRTLEISVQAAPRDWRTVWQIIATISAETNVALEDLTLVLRERGQVVSQDMWALSNRDVLSSVLSTLARLNVHGAFKRFLLKKTASEGWSSEEEVFPDALQSHAGISRVPFGRLGGLGLGEHVRGD
ncbi:hypothetical protein PsYK624_087170 [Phanerochaete sordida]|uniref:Uncharacterized protein n=1 Tax=Phanerochaete sordida TaxID=48140 RepID=A0A9P3LG00_9APHY|nr:hypothetical protein PsYK624_087170 [Phanerochaete sordida]